MNEKLIVKDFGPIREAEIDLRKTTVFIGEQGSGKSTLAKLIAIVKDIRFINSFRENKTIESFKKYNIQNYFTPSISSFLFEAEVYSIIFDQDKIRYEQFHWSKNTQLSKEKINEIQTEANETNKKIQNEPVFAEQEKLTKDFIKKYPEGKKFFFMKTPIYIPTERFLISAISGSLLSFVNNNIALPKILTEFGNTFEIARREIGELNIDYLGIKYKFENGIDSVYNAKNKALNLSESSSGYQSIIPMNMVVEYVSESHIFAKTFIIEEPELNLFPTIQKEVVNYLVNRCTKGENELVITTHSPYVLSALNNLLFAYKTAEKYPERADEISAKIPRESWLNPKEFNAYFVGNGTVRSIFNEENGLIADNELDEISIELSEERDFLMDIYFGEIA